MFRYFWIVIIASLVVGCSDVNPTVSFLGSTADDFTFKNSNVVTADLSAVPLIATCSSFISRVEMSFDNGSTWIETSSYQAGSTCSGGSFSITLSSSKAPLSSKSFVNGDIIKVKFRAYRLPSSSLNSQDEVNITYTPSGTLSNEVLAGTATQVGGAFVLKGKARFQKQHLATGGGFVVHGRITQ